LVGEPPTRVFFIVNKASIGHNALPAKSRNKKRAVSSLGRKQGSGGLEIRSSKGQGRGKGKQSSTRATPRFNGDSLSKGFLKTDLEGLGEKRELRPF